MTLNYSNNNKKWCLYQTILSNYIDTHFSSTLQHSRNNCFIKHRLQILSLSVQLTTKHPPRVFYKQYSTINLKLKRKVTWKSVLFILCIKQTFQQKLKRPTRTKRKKLGKSFFTYISI